MPGWATLYARMRSEVHSRILAEAQKDNRSASKWVEEHFRTYFAELDARETESPNG